MAKINVQNTEITIVSHNDDDYISLTDMARSQLQEHIIFRWLSLKSTIEYLGEWEMLYNPNFNCTEFGTFRNMAGSNNFVLSVKTWIEKTGAIGIFSKAGRYGGTYAHRDIAYHFGMWISGIPTTESRRAEDVGLDSKERTIQNQLSHSYGCH